jgi:broad specificity phosphatase PhoE
MTRVLFIRHGRTSWNDEKRIQGHTDIPLSDAGRAELGALEVPAEYRNWQVHASPLQRAVESARLLKLASPNLDPRLMEMSYGDWEGATLAELEARYGDALAIRARRGLHFRPDGGESPADLKARLVSWLEQIRGLRQNSVAVTHKGVIRMALALATGWDLVSKAPVRLRWDCAHLFDLPEEQACAIQVAGLNLELRGP